jgi:hypothetical protein
MATSRELSPILQESVTNSKRERCDQMGKLSKISQKVVEKLFYIQ